MPFPIRALIFDFDGLIFDTETTEMVVWRRIYAGYGFEFPDERWAHNAGLWNSNHRWDPAAHLQGLLGEPLDLQALSLRHHDESVAALETQAPVEGVTQYLDAAARLGLRLAVASSSPLYWVEGHLARLGLLKRFERITSGDDVAPERVKPQPDIYLKALQALELPAAQALAFEDSQHGVMAARAAGIFVVAVLNPTTALLQSGGADLVLDSFTDMPLERLLERVGEAAARS